MASHGNGTDQPAYKGPERRKYARRTVADRRKAIRWEPDNPNRRSNPGRRAADALGAFNHSKR
jgi:hypothetical protein